MITNKIIKFGYGTVLTTGNELSRVLFFQHIAPPKVIGEIIKDSDSYSVIGTLKFEYSDDMKILFENLNNIHEFNFLINFRDYTLDFTNYNEKSIEVVKRAVSRVIIGFQLSLAC